jgi:ferrochelatase
MQKGVILFNLGGPETLADVRPFLFRLFSDPDIIRIRSKLVRNTLAWLIATARQQKSRNLYRQIGGGSPLRKITEGQAKALEERLAMRGFPARVYVGMRCWKPTIDEAVEQARRDGITQLIAFPLFPQFSVTTTGSCFGYFRSVAQQTGLAATARIAYVDAWYSEPLYIESIVELIQDSLKGFSETDPEKIRLLYSAHSIPARYVKEGDPYVEQTQMTVALINERLGNVVPSRLAFQSKIGPVRWLEPSTREVLEEFGRTGVGRVLAIPISFVSDHIETLQEIDILYKQVAIDAGIKEFRRAASLNLHPKFIDGLANIAIAAFQER